MLVMKAESPRNAMEHRAMTSGGAVFRGKAHRESNRAFPDQDGARSLRSGDRGSDRYGVRLSTTCLVSGRARPWPRPLAMRAEVQTTT
jgi:hypothetical protein